jgi:carboxyl-terminal processing protease
VSGVAPTKCFPLLNGLRYLWVEVVPIKMRHSKIKALAVVVLLALLIINGCDTTRNIPTTPAPIAPLPLTTGATDGRIGYLTARLLEEFHYSQHVLDTEMSVKFFDGYLGGMLGLDPRHENFLQSDIDEFAPWRTNLDTLTASTNGIADLTPAFAIFQRFMERLQQHVAYVHELLKEDKFQFTGDDRYLLDRRQAPWPKDLQEAKLLWRDRLRYEFLQEKLSREISPTNGETVLSLPKSADAEISEHLTRHYDLNLHTATNWDSTDVLQAYLDALAHAYDPHSDYLNTAHAQDFSIEMSLSLFGIGAQLTEDDGYCTISKLILGGPADKSKKLNEKDRIVAVAQSNRPPVEVVDMELGKVVQLIRGAKGTEVRLTISPADDRAVHRIVTLTRDEIKLEDSAAKAQLIESPDGQGGTNRLGVIDLPSFYATIDLPGNSGRSTPRSTTADVTRLIKKLEQEKAGGIILDLRSNPGGSLEEAIKFTGLFIKDGPVVLARSPDGNVSVDTDTDSSVLYDGPLIVLVNRGSASAAEIAAAALQDYGRALVVGDTSTHGKGTVQNLNPLRPFVWSAAASASNDPGTVKITIRKFYRVSGASTQLKGVVSDIILPDWLSYRDDIGETSLENPLPWDTIPSVAYNKLDLVEPYLPRLRQHSDERIATNQDFIYIRQDIDQFKKLQADKTATLNEHDALKERQTNQARQKTRDQDRDARKIPDVKIYEITVENSDQAGLPTPQPLTSTNYIATTNGVTFNVDSSFTNYFGTNTATKINLKTEIKTLPPDPLLVETENILEDYISLLQKNAALTANH